MRIKSIRDAPLEGKRVLVRVDFNVPLDEAGNVRNDKRIRESLPTIKYLLERNAKVILMSHAGRPKGKAVPSLRLDGVGKRLSSLLRMPVKKMDDCVGEKVSRAAESMSAGDVMLLENLRFHPEEKKNDPAFSKQLASLGKIYVNDAFATCHREEASMVGVLEYLPGYAGFLVEKEVDTITRVLEHPQHPFVAMLGGVKLETRIPLIRHLAEKVDRILLGGAMIFTFFKARGYSIGNSLCDDDQIENARLLEKEYGNKLVLPTDVVVADELAPDVETSVVPSHNMPDGKLGLDIGPETVEHFINELRQAKSVVWNGPLGAFETKPFDEGSRKVAEALAEMGITTVIGGGDTAALIESFSLEDRFTLVSTGGGASLALLEGQPLPALVALEKNQERFGILH